METPVQGCTKNETPLQECIENERMNLESNLLGILPDFDNLSRKSEESCKVSSDIEGLQNSSIMNIKKRKCFKKIRLTKQKY